jgi:YlmC/YmxH family sporulation protein
MRRISTADLREREVINLCGGEKLGYICDFEIDTDCGKILALIVTGNTFSLFGKREEYVVPWNNIECIGEDTVLVRISKNEICRADCKNKQKKC